MTETEVNTHLFKTLSGAVVLDVDVHVAALVISGKPHVTHGVLALRQSLLWRLHPVIHRVADKVHKRVVKLFYYRLVYLRRVA